MRGSRTWVCLLIITARASSSARARESGDRVIESPGPDGRKASSGRMVIERWTGPPADTHTYLVADEQSGEAWAIDAPLDTAARLLERVRSRGLRLTRLILTHGHFDHILDAERYREAGIP